MIETIQPALARLLVAQTDPGIGIEIDATDGLLGGAVSAFLTTLIVGAIMIAVAPAFTERMMADALENPVGSFVYGILSIVGIVMLAFLLFITLVGILVAIPLLLVAYLLWAIGTVVGYLAIADRLVGHEDGWLKPVLVAAGFNGALALTGIGGLVSLCVGAVGFGAVLRDVLD